MLWVAGGNDPIACTTVPKWTTVTVRTLPDYTAQISGDRTLDMVAKAEARKLNLPSIQFERSFKDSHRIVTFVLEDRAAIRADLTTIMSCTCGAVISRALEPAGRQ